jgi:hypothetical protein
MATETELDAIVAEMKVVIPLAPEAERKRSFRAFQELRDFLAEEVRFWQAVGIPEVSQAFSQISGRLVQIAQDDIKGARNQIVEAVRLATSGNVSLIYSDTARARFLKRLADPEAARSAFYYFRGTPNQGEQGRQFNPLGSSATFNGLVAALLSQHPEFVSSELPAEIESFRHQRAAVDAFSEETRVQFRSLTEQVEQWKAATQTQLAALLTEHKELFEREHQEQTSKFQQEQADQSKRMKELEALYLEKLRLNEPAKYWGELQVEYQRQGLWWIGAAIAIAMLGIGWLTHFVYKPPEIWNSASFTLSGVKGALLIGAAISAILYILNLVIKIATSSYHLSRDARERQQLTHVFLALIKDNAIEPKDREIVLSALFSRSDTGLLKGDAAPAFPPLPLGSILDGGKK